MKKKRVVGSAAVAVVIVSAVVALQFLPKRPPAIRIEKEFLTVDAPVGGNRPNEDISACFLIHNDGGLPLEITDLIERCGCSKLWVEEKQIAGGGSTKLWARITPVGFSRRVGLRVESNDPKRAGVECVVDVVQKKSPPLLMLERTPFIWLGNACRKDKSIPVTVFTLEPRGSKSNWIASAVVGGEPPFRATIARCADAAIQIEPDGVLREYAIELAPSAEDPGREFSGVLVLHDASPREIGRIPTSGRMGGWLVATPSTLISKRSDPFPQKHRVVVRSEDGFGGLTLTHEERRQTPVEVSIENSKSLEAVVVLSVAAPLAKKVEKVELKTNHPKQDRLLLQLHRF